MAALDQVKADAEAIQAVGRSVGPKYLAGNAPFQDQVQTRGLVFDFLWNHALMLRGWAERAEVTIAEWDDLSPAQRNEAALAIIHGNLELEASDAATDCRTPSA